MRHLFATHYLRSGGSVALLRRILGHAALETVLIYEHLLTDDLSEAHNGHSILARSRADFRGLWILSEKLRSQLSESERLNVGA